MDGNIEKFSIVKKGYSPAEVDKYVDELEEIVRSYKSKDASIKNAILNSQIAADDILDKAEVKSREMIKNTEDECRAMRRDVIRFLDDTLETIEYIDRYIKSADEVKNYIEDAKASILEQGRRP